MKWWLAAVGIGVVCMLALGAPGRDMAHRPGRVFDPERWFQCESNSDCALLSGSSCTAPVAIHAAFVTVYNQKHATEPTCGPVAPGDTAHHAVCRNDRCIVVEGVEGSAQE